jgi:hypothetical protein
VERVSMRRSRERKGQKESKLKREEKKGKHSNAQLLRSSSCLTSVYHLLPPPDRLPPAPNPLPITSLTYSNRQTRALALSSVTLIRLIMNP